MFVSSASATDTGLRRSINEDSLLVREDLGCFLVADGLGGHAAGEAASRTAVDGVVKFIEATRAGPSEQTWPVPFDPQQSMNANRLRAGFQMGNQLIARQIASSSELRGMSTTAVAVLLDEDATTGTLAHVGDSRAYMFHEGRLEQLTRDHSWVEEQIQLGTLTESAALQHPWRNVVTRAMSGTEDLEVDLKEVSLEPGNRLLLCSDGLSSVLSDEEIADRLRRESDLSDACRSLIQGANDGGGPDNVTVIVLDIHAR